ncbi:MAG: hypothetical protein NT093_02965 [Candidatus Moranbacteria bacterium]|nr:hypothetical protein [Candidatus Moranbacteria bacterium]
MNIGNWAFWLTMLLVVVQGIISFREKTFSLYQKRDIPIRLSFLWHWANLADFFILPQFNLYAAPLVFEFSAGWLALFLLGATMITTACYLLWWFESKKASGFIIIYGWRSGGNPRHFLKDITVAGWVHFLLMTFQLTIVGAYLFTSMPPAIVLETCWLSMIFTLLAVIEPGIVAEWPRISYEGVKGTFTMAVFLSAIIIIVTIAKL